MMSFRAPFVVACLTVASFAAPAHAQQMSPDFNRQVQTTLPSNEQLLGQIQDALPTEDLSTVVDQTNGSVSTAQDLVDQLQSALSLAPDDITRSRIEGVLSHTHAALDSLEAAQSESSLDSARGRLDQARGEAQEALSELRPFVLGLVATGDITGK